MDIQSFGLSYYLSRIGLDPRVITFLENIDTGVIGFKVKKNPYSKKFPLTLQRDMIASARRDIDESIDF